MVMRVCVMRCDTPKRCKELAREFVSFVATQFDSLGYELNERIVWPRGTGIWIDQAYLKNWTAFESNGYRG